MYRIQIRATAQRQLTRLPGQAQKRIRNRIRSLAEDPRSRGVQKLVGQKDTYRIRVGEYRILYEIHDEVLLITVISIGHRREIYR